LECFWEGVQKRLWDHQGLIEGAGDSRGDQQPPQLEKHGEKLRTSNRELEEKLKKAREAQIDRGYETTVLEEKPMDTEVISTQEPH